MVIGSSGRATCVFASLEYILCTSGQQQVILQFYTLVYALEVYYCFFIALLTSFLSSPETFFLTSLLPSMANLESSLGLIASHRKDSCPGAERWELLRFLLVRFTHVDTERIFVVFPRF